MQPSPERPLVSTATSSAPARRAEHLPVEAHGRELARRDDTTTDVLPRPTDERRDLAERDPEPDEFHVGKIVIAGLDRNIRSRAIDAAHDRLNRELAEGSLPRRFFKSIWKGNWAREVYLKRYEVEAAAEIVRQNNLLQNEGVVDRSYLDHTVERFASDFEEEVIHRAAGERYAKFGAETADDHQREVRARILEIIKDDAAGAFATPEAFEEHKKEVMARLIADGHLDEHDIDSTRLFADNLHQVAMTVRARLGVEGLDAATDEAKRARMDELLANAELIVGEAKVGARAEGLMSRTDRLLDRLSDPERLSSRVLPWFNETTLAVGAAAAISVAEWVKGRAIGWVGRFIAPGAAAAYIVGANEARRLRHERTQHSRARAEGQFEGATLHGRREHLERTRVETVAATDLTNWLREFYSDTGDLSLTSPDQFNELMERLAHTKARVDMSDDAREDNEQRRIDFISTSTVGDQQGERWQLDLAMAQLQVDLRRHLEGLSEDDLRTYGYTDQEIALITSDAADRLDDRLEAMITAHEGILMDSVHAADSSWQRVRIAEVAKKAGVAGLTGLFLGATIAEAVAAVSENQDGLFERGSAGSQQETLLDRAWEPIINDDAPAESAGSRVTQLGEGTTVSLPQGYSMEFDKESKSFSLVGPDGLKVDDLKLTKDGSLTAESAAALQAAGIEPKVSHAGTTSEKIRQEVKVKASDFAERHTKETTEVRHLGWLDNDTVGIFDKNEQGLNRGFREADGDIRIEIGRMTEHGSYHRGVEVNWQEEAARGNIQVTVYADRGSYHEGFTFAVDEKGRAIIPEGHPAQQLFSEGKGRLDFNGYLYEAQYVDRVSNNGTQHVWTLATAVGEKDKAFVDIVEQTVNKPNTIYTFDRTIDGPQGPDDTIPPYFVPLVGRRGLQTPDSQDRAGRRNGGEPAPDGPPSPAAPITLGVPPNGRGPVQPPPDRLPPIDRTNGTIYYGENYVPPERRTPPTPPPRNDGPAAAGAGRPGNGGPASGERRPRNDGSFYYLLPSNGSKAANFTPNAVRQANQIVERVWDEDPSLQPGNYAPGSYEARDAQKRTLLRALQLAHTDRPENDDQEVMGVLTAANKALGPRGSWGTPAGGAAAAPEAGAQPQPEAPRRPRPAASTTPPPSPQPATPPPQPAPQPAAQPTTPPAPETAPPTPTPEPVAPTPTPAAGQPTPQARGQGERPTNQGGEQGRPQQTPEERRARAERFLDSLARSAGNPERATVNVRSNAFNGPMVLTSTSEGNYTFQSTSGGEPRTYTREELLDLIVQDRVRRPRRQGQQGNRNRSGGQGQGGGQRNRQGGNQGAQGDRPPRPRRPRPQAGGGETTGTAQTP